MGEVFQFHREIIVCGDDALANTIIDELRGAGARIIRITSAADLLGAGVTVPCPGRDQQVYAGDWTSMIGVKDELEARGITVPPSTATRSRHSNVRRAIDAVRAMRADANPVLLPSLLFTLVLMFAATAMVRFTYMHPRMSWLDALYFTSETITSVGFGDFSFAAQSSTLRLFAIGLMFGGVMVTAILVAIIADLLLSRRLAHTAGRRRDRHMRDHVVVVGLGSIGIRVVSDLAAAGYDVVVVEKDENNRFLAAAAELDVPVIFGDATMRQTLESARIHQARGVAVVTQDDMENIRTGIVLLEILGSNTSTPLVMRVHGRTLGAAVNQQFGFENVRSIVDLAAPWFIGAAMGLKVLGTFWVGQRSFMVGAMLV